MFPNTHVEALQGKQNYFKQSNCTEAFLKVQLFYMVLCLFFFVFIYYVISPLATFGALPPVLCYDSRGGNDFFFHSTLIILVRLSNPNILLLFSELKQLQSDIMFSMLSVSEKKTSLSTWQEDNNWLAPLLTGTGLVW